MQPERGGPLVVAASAPAVPAPTPPNVGGAVEQEGLLLEGEAASVVSAVPGPRRAWLVVGPCPPTSDPRAHARFLLPVVAQVLQATLEVEHAAKELAERYEEINLLYTTSEILGRTVRLEEAAATILTEISETVGARRASILVHDRVTDTLQMVAAFGASSDDAPPISVDDQCSVSARVFRTQHPLIVEGDEMHCEAESGYRRGAMLSVPIMWTTPEGGEPL